MIRFAICGGGPAGFYSAGRLLSLSKSELLSRNSIKVDLFEALPTPYGLSRYGVAPDHPEVKKCETKFSEIAEHPNFRFFGNTRLIDRETDILSRLCREKEERTAFVTLDSLRQEYDVVLLAYGASLDRSLGGIPGEGQLENILPARTAVNWYNGFPTYKQDQIEPAVDLSQVKHVTIVGQGNVALDIARILLTPVEDLAKTDISSNALQALAKSQVRHVDIVGRRGPLQVAFTTKELRELIKLKEVDLKIDHSILSDSIKRLNEPQVLEHMSNGRMSKRLLELMYKASQDVYQNINQRKTCSLTFLRAPLAFKTSSNTKQDVDSNKVKSVEWQLNKLDYPETQPDSGHQTLPIPDYSSIRAIPIKTEKNIITSTDLVFKSLGYQPVIIEPLELDRIRSCAKNQSGRVIDKQNRVVPRLYVTGWLSRGPNGVIANTMNEAFQTVDTMIDDLQPTLSSASLPTSQNSSVDDFFPTLINRSLSVDWNQWKTLDHIERLRGNSICKPREKILSIVEMLKILRIS